MPKYTTDIVAGYVLYYTSKCVIEAMHVHASDKALTEHGSAKLFVYDNGDTKIQNRGNVSPHDLRDIQAYIKKNYKWMYKRWRENSNNGFYTKR